MLVGIPTPAWEITVRVLVVDDDRALRDALRRSLVLSGYRRWS